MPLENFWRTRRQWDHDYGSITDESLERLIDAGAVEHAGGWSGHPLLFRISLGGEHKVAAHYARARLDEL